MHVILWRQIVCFLGNKGSVVEGSVLDTNEIRGGITQGKRTLTCCSCLLPKLFKYFSRDLVLSEIRCRKIQLQNNLSQVTGIDSFIVLTALGCCSSLGEKIQQSRGFRH
ncbi:hypothetical protein KP509_19G034800 [Ceratopteris richardii]|uniref:Uncharacterized protein n=1 Tax=Ceratopteris richardii TaxID=49495 RepID=A0A8T2SMW5_CERRI|nr:hypothetical protein KP509_19G034800 [Ceratopteris richardii]